MKILVTLFLFLNLVFASQYEVGSDLSKLVVNDQFDKELNVSNEIKKVFVVFSKDLGAQIKEFLEKNPNYLKDNSAIYLADVSAAPSFVTNMFMVPKFKKYNYSMGLIRDEELAKQFPAKEEMITVINVENSKITTIEYIKSLQ